MLRFASMHPRWLSNTWLLADEPGGACILVDSGGPLEPILARIDEWRVTPTHLFCTHHHFDHVAGNDEIAEKFDIPILGHREEAPLFERLDRELAHGDRFESGRLSVEVLHVPGHTLGQCAFLFLEDGTPAAVCTGDTLFHGSVGGTCGPGHTTIEDLRRSVLEVLMKLPGDLLVLPGHTRETTIGREWEENPFVRSWRGVDPVRESPCTALGREALLLVDAEDYDGGRKCEVRFLDDSSEAVVPGSRVEPRG